MTRSRALPAHTNALVAAVGETLYGPSWRGALAEAMSVDRATVRRWANGGTVPPCRWDEMRSRLLQRQDEIDSLLADIEDARAAMARPSPDHIAKGPSMG